MSEFPSHIKVAGSHLSSYDKYYNLVDPYNHGEVKAMHAAKFLKQSQLSDALLSKIWDVADPSSRGVLDKTGMFVALKLCALAQQGENITMSNIYMDVPPPKMIEIANISKIIQCTNASNKIRDWSINSLERYKYEQLFKQLEPVDGYISGNKVKAVLMDSKLPLDILGKIWDLADIDKDGKLNQHEFTIAMHLVYKTLERKAVSNILPSELMDTNLSNSADFTSQLQLSQISMANTEISNTSIAITLEKEKKEDNNDVCKYTNSDLDIITQDIIEINSEKHALNQDISQKEADIKVKNGELKSLQSEIDTLAATLKQLDNQKGEAQKRLHDLKIQVTKLRQQCCDQESNLQIQEDYLNTKRAEIECLKLTEQNLQIQEEDNKNWLNRLSQNLQDIQLEISQTKAIMIELDEQQDEIVDAVAQNEKAFYSKKCSLLPDTYLEYEWKFGENKFIADKIDTFIHGLKIEDLQKNCDINKEVDHQPAASVINCSDNVSHKHDFFIEDYEPRSRNISDPFGEDPFAALHAPIRSESPSPALPPKKSKQPPPRPAPPRPSHALQGTCGINQENVTVVENLDPFTRETMRHNISPIDFADFSNFHTK